MVRLVLYGACTIGTVYLVARIVYLTTFLWLAATQKGRRRRCRLVFRAASFSMGGVFLHQTIEQSDACAALSLPYALGHETFSSPVTVKLFL